jgi:predicted nucleic acid-binding protein
MARRGRQSGTLKLVLDTNAWLDWLVFRDPAMEPIAAAVTAGTAHVVIDEPCDVELERALGYDLGRYSLDPAHQAEALQRSRKIAVRVATEGAGDAPSSLPQCRDRDDQKFLTLALAAGAQALITRDRALLELTRRRFAPLPFRIVTPRAAAIMFPAGTVYVPASTIPDTP